MSKALQQLHKMTLFPAGPCRMASNSDNCPAYRAVSRYAVSERLSNVSTREPRGGLAQISDPLGAPGGDHFRAITPRLFSGFLPASSHPVSAPFCPLFAPSFGPSFPALFALFQCAILRDCAH